MASLLRLADTLKYLANAHLNPLNIGLWFRGRPSQGEMLRLFDEEQFKQES
ncbi:hypothetical protein [Mesorhizobium sp. ORM16]|uniref:hypothetical protein n=1 Tax=Mesorhizobium sp. ORM16 TaxID=3376989 RepID=UPI003857ECCF